MALYLAQLALDKKSEHPLLVERGVEKRTLAPLSSLNIYGRVTEREVAYAGYVLNIGVFMSATSLQKKLPIKAEASGHSPDVSRIHWRPRMPPVSFASKSKLSEERQTMLLETFPDGQLDFTKSGEFSKVTIRNASDRIISTLLPLAANFNRSDNLELPIHSYSTFRLLTLIVNDFIATNTYPAFKEFEGEAIEDGQMEYMEVLRVPEFYYEPKTRGGKKVKDVKWSDIAPMATDDEDEDMDVEIEMEGKSMGTMREAVFVAKPSPVPASNNVGTPSEVPNLPGIFFPYFHRIIVPDFVTIPRFIGKYFFGYLGSTAASAQKQYDSLVRDWNGISTTEAGMVLAHVLFGIKLCLETQSRLFVLQSGVEYHGFVLLGAKFVVYDGTNYVSPESPDKLRSHISEHASKHYTSLGEITSALNVKRLANHRSAIKVEEISSGLKLMKLVAGENWEDEELERLQVLVGKLNFRRTFWTINPQTIQAAIDLLTTDSATPLDDTKYPAFPGPDVNMYGMRTYQVLSFFGPTSFSFINGSGKKIQIPTMVEPDVFTTGQAEGRDADLTAMHVGMKKLSEAVKDFQTMKEEGWIRQDMRERAGKYRHYVYAGKWLDELWGALRVKIAPSVDRSVVADKGKGKAPAAEGKKRKEIEAEVEDFFAGLTKRARA